MRLSWVLAVIAGCCPSEYTALEATGTRAAQLDQRFHQDPRWLGGDGAYTIDLGGDRTLWLYGDSFIATTDAHVRTESTMVRNSLSIMTGRDLATADMAFAWRDGAPPTSFFPEQGDHWFWPSDGVRVPDGPLVVFLSEERPTPGDGLGFAAAGFGAVRIADPLAPPATWTLESTAAHAPAFAPDANVACGAVDGDHFVALVTSGTDHEVRVARWALTDIATGDLSWPEWWTGAGWTLETALAGAPSVVIDSGQTECSIHYRAGDLAWIYVATEGFGATSIITRTAPAPTGPWTDPTPAFTPPESMVPNAFVYAAKAHPMLDADNNLSFVVTYADNSFTFADLFNPAKAGVLYWPHVAMFELFSLVAC